MAYEVRSERLELVTKLPKDKAPYMGILFTSARTASYLNQSWVNEYKSQVFQLNVEFRNRKLFLTLSLLDFRLRHTYEVDTYDPHKLKAFLQKISSVSKINFGHVIRDHDKQVPAKTIDSRAYWVLGVNAVFVEGEQYL